MAKKTLTPAERARNSRNIALALALVALCILFFVMTIVRMGAQVAP